MPPPPIRLRIAYGPSCLGSSAPSGAALLISAPYQLSGRMIRSARLGGPGSARRRLARRLLATGPGGAGGVAGGADGLAAAGDAAEDLVDVGAVDGLAFQQQLAQPVERVAVGTQQVKGALLGLAQQLADLLVDDPLGRLRIGPRADLLAAQIHRAARGEPDRAERAAHAELADHPHGKIGRAGQVVGGAGGALVE